MAIDGEQRQAGRRDGDYERAMGRSWHGEKALAVILTSLPLLRSPEHDTSATRAVPERRMRWKLDFISTSSHVSKLTGMHR